ARRELIVPAGNSAKVTWSLDATQGWYDVTVTCANAEGFLRRFAGKVDNGRAGLTDPGIGDLRVTV
ncbi:MAG TPA: phospholipase domain-containing protein, partial [Sphingomonadaceae bacterium]|nr:phospholipase domain-containing protein [Sphingomonadaceae bacterium]